MKKLKLRIVKLWSEKQFIFVIEQWVDEDELCAGHRNAAGWYGWPVLLDKAMAFETEHEARVVAEAVFRGDDTSPASVVATYGV